MVVVVGPNNADDPEIVSRGPVVVMASAKNAIAGSATGADLGGDTGVATGVEAGRKSGAVTGATTGVAGGILAKRVTSNKPTGQKDSSYAASTIAGVISFPVLSTKTAS